MAASTPIRASGVVLLRETPDGQEFLLVHRPGRADWSLPKGKIESGEHMLAAAVRECDEESGYTPVLMAPLPSQSYSVGSRPKVVNYWRGRVREEVGFAPDDEIDEVLWLPTGEARAQLTYASEAGLVEAATALPDSLPLVILRHSQALKRSHFDGDDDAERPLSGKGRSQSKALIPLLDAFGITSVHSSPSRRCHDTVKRFAKHADTPVVPAPALSEEAFEHDGGAAAEATALLAVTREPLVICSHRPVLPTILDTLASTLGMDPDDRRWRKVWDPKLSPSSFLVIHRSFTDDDRVEVVGVEHHTLAHTTMP